MSHKRGPVEHVTIGDRGRLVLPARVREELRLHAGTRVALSVEADGSLRLRPYRAIAQQGRGLWADLAPGTTSLSEELIADRRAEAAQEDRDP